MKRISLICAALAATLSMSAQKALVDEVKNDVKGNSANAQAALQKIQPALTNPESAQQAYTWYTAGDAALKAYDHLRALEGLNPSGLTDEQKKNAGTDLNQAFEYFVNALPLDQQPDAKGKVKPKYTKDIMKAMSSNYREYQRAGIYLYEAQDYPGAIKAWDIYINLPKDPRFADAKITADPDTIVGQMMYYQALAMTFNNEQAKAVERLRDAINSGLDNMEVYQNALAVATQAGDSAAMIEFAQKGYDKYGVQNIAFIGQLINEKLNKGDYPACVDYVNKALAGNPDNETQAQLYDILGCIDAEQNKNDEAYANFSKAVELNPNFAKGYFDQARMVFNKAVNAWDEADEATRQNVLTPDIKRACGLFEKAYELDENAMSNIPGILYRAYYLIEGEESPNTQKWHNM